MKRLVFCFDGSWNRLDTDCPTNVVLMAENVPPIASDGTPQIVYYDEGVGTRWYDKFLGGLFGVGLLTNLEEAYRFLLFNYEPGDQIYIFGFSRGAYTARSFAGLLRHVGIIDVISASKIKEAFKLYKAALKKDGDDHPRTLKFRSEYSKQVCVSEHDHQWRCEHQEQFQPSTPILEIRYVGVWDTVGALGVPNVIPLAGWLNHRLGFHDVRLTSKVQAARHALALDERRKPFRPTVWNNVADLNADRDSNYYSAEALYQQKWFPGVHGAVGGGGSDRALSDNTFSWVLVGARRQDLEINASASSRVWEMEPRRDGPLQNEPKRPWHDWGPIGWIKDLISSGNRNGPLHLNDVSAFARWRWHADPASLPEGRIYRPKSLKNVADELDALSFFETDIETKSLNTYCVKPGDDLPKIAQKLYGDASKSEHIFEANADLIEDPREIHPGWILRIPPSTSN